MKLNKISVLSHLSKRARRSTNERITAYNAVSNINASFTRCTLCHTAVLPRAWPLHAYCCYERFVASEVGLRYQTAQVELFVTSSDAPDPWLPVEATLRCMRVGCGATATQRPRAIHQSLFILVVQFMLNSDTQSAQAATCSTVLQQSLTSGPGS
jgi:hypothetical protein